MMGFIRCITYCLTVCIFLIKEGQAVEASLRIAQNCPAYIHQYETKHRIPRGLLQAISKAESGRKDDTGRIAPWPWTINVQGEGHFFATKQEAIKAVKALQAKGIKSIDVGCMQVNLYHHPHAFKTLEDAFEPSKNVAYAAQFLTNLQRNLRSWHLAMAHYHSANPVFHIPYQKTVMNFWRRDQKRGPLKSPLKAALIARSHASPHVRRLPNGRRLSLEGSSILDGNEVRSVSYPRAVRRRVGGYSSHVRRLKL
jgi:hypothetical protein